MRPSLHALLLLPSVHALMRVRLVSVGKNKEHWLQEAVGLYAKRLTGTLDLECLWVKDDAALLSQAKSEQTETRFFLDPEGPQYTSEEFSAVLFSALERGGSRAAFFIGGAEGLPKELKRRKRTELIGLSKMTFTHQMARLLLVEQIYRAAEIRKGSGYHKRALLAPPELGEALSSSGDEMDAMPCGACCGAEEAESLATAAHGVVRGDCANPVPTAASGHLADPQAWLAEWRRRIECWWIGTPHRQGLRACFSSLLLLLTRRFEAMARGSGLMLEPSTAPAQLEQGCEWVTSEQLDSLPEFPSLPDALFELPPIPRVLPTWEHLERVAAAAIGSDTLERPQPLQWQQSLRQQGPNRSWTSVAMGAGAGIAAAIGAAALGVGMLCFRVDSQRSLDAKPRLELQRNSVR